MSHLPFGQMIVSVNSERAAVVTNCQRSWHLSRQLISRPMPATTRNHIGYLSLTAERSAINLRVTCPNNGRVSAGIDTVAGC